MMEVYKIRHETEKVENTVLFSLFHKTSLCEHSMKSISSRLKKVGYSPKEQLRQKIHCYRKW